MTIDYLADRPKAVMDIECLPNFFAVGFRDIVTKKRALIWTFEDEPPLELPRIARLMRHYRVHTFNGIHYDLPMLALAMSGASCSKLKAASDDIIVGGLKHWQFYEKYGVSLPDFVDHIDLMEVAPAAAQRFSLKKYAGTMHSRTMMEFEHDFDSPLERGQIEDCLTYLENDLEVTSDLAQELASQIELRAEISKQYGIDVRSKSDAQMAEVMIKADSERILNRKLFKEDFRARVFKYEVPAYIQFSTTAMRDALSTILRAKFVVRSDGYVELPSELKAMVITVGDQSYKIGIGGLHSMESRASHYEDEDHFISDVDANSFYPNLIIQAAKEPKQLRGAFLQVYKGIVAQRLAAKARVSELKKRIAALEAEIANSQ